MTRISKEEIENLEYLIDNQIGYYRSYRIKRLLNDRYRSFSKESEDYLQDELSKASNEEFDAQRNAPYYDSHDAIGE